MRKRTMLNFADTAFWYFLYFMPVIAYFLYLFVVPEPNGPQPQAINFIDFFNNSAFGIAETGIIFTTLKSIFGPGGVLAMFQTDTIFLILSWFISTFIIHLAVDFLLFIPKLAQKWMHTFTQGE